mmetsp:Transcript_16219/g.32640  ORF Transcript_16219/g.32640 Transcript_16219/m.32640 type:complete len:175 (+) Transcript_16219:277-801(+)
MSSNEDKAVLNGQCYCGAVQLRASAMPDVQAICHCTACRRFGGSLVFVTLFPPEKLTITGDMIVNDPKKEGFHMGYPEGSEVGPVKDTEDGKTKLYQPRGFSVRKTCAKCHSNILNDHGEIVDVNGGVWDWGADGFRPVFHLNYESAVLKMKDGLPKFKDFPSDFGGSDEKVEE